LTYKHGRGLFLFHWLVCVTVNILSALDAGENAVFSGRNLVLIINMEEGCFCFVDWFLVIVTLVKELMLIGTISHCHNEHEF
jgi:hypothetical protein